MRALKTVGGIRASGVFGREMEPGVVDARKCDVEATGLNNGGTGRGCVDAGRGTGEASFDVEATGAAGAFEEELPRGFAFGVESRLPEASLSWSDFILRVSDSTLDVSFFFSLISLQRRR